MGKIVRLFVFFLVFASFLWADLIITDQHITKTRITLELDRPIKKSDFNAFLLKTSGDPNYRRVIDIKAKFKAGKYSSDQVTIPSLKIAQYNPSTTRVVLTHSKLFNISIKPHQNELIIDIDAKEDDTKTVEKAHKPDGNTPLIVIDAGHGGKDTGAIGVGGIKEKDVVLKVAIDTAQKLKAQGYEVVMTRDSDKYIALQDRTALANKVKADLFISIHANASPKGTVLKGLETYFLSPARSERAKDVAALENSVVVENMGKFSQATFLNFLNRETVVASNKLAIDIQRGMLLRVRTKFPSVADSAVREGPFWVLVGAQMPAVLVEIGYLTNQEEVRWLTNSTYQDLIASGIVYGVDSYFSNLGR